MPPKVVKPSGAGQNYGNPFIHSPREPIAVPLDIDNPTASFLDAQGVLKPGTMLCRRANGTYTIPDATAGEAVYGVVAHPIKVALTNAAADKTAAGTIDVAVFRGPVNRKIIENNLGRVLSAAEIAAFGTVGSNCDLVA